jgi:hypothetical protein
MPSINAVSPKIKVWSLTLIGLDLPLTALVGIAENRKQILTYTQETKRAMLERLLLARHIHRYQ